MYGQIHTHLCITHGVQTSIYIYNKNNIPAQHWSSPKEGGRGRGARREPSVLQEMLVSSSSSISTST